MKGWRDKTLCEVTEDHRHAEGRCWWYAPAEVRGPYLGQSPRWVVTVDDDGIAWTWCYDP